MAIETTPADSQEREPVQQEAQTDEIRPWVQVEPGRFMPRRIRGSFRGGRLG